MNIKYNITAPLGLAVTTLLVHDLTSPLHFQETEVNAISVVRREIPFLDHDHRHSSEWSQRDGRTVAATSTSVVGFTVSSVFYVDSTPFTFLH